MLEKLKVAKLEKKIAEQKLLKMKELEDRIVAFETRFNKGIEILRKSMITNAFCLEFNKDLYDTILQLTNETEDFSQEFEEGIVYAVKQIKKLQESHNIFNSNITNVSQDGK